MILEQQLVDILESSRYLLSNIKPVEWAEKNRTMTSEVSPWPGKFSFKRTPYLKEIVNRISLNDPARIIAVIKGAQIGFSVGVIENGIGYIIDQQPGNILFMSGDPKLSEEAMTKKIDQMIDSCGLKHLIRPNTIKKKNQRTGDTSKSKEFPGGSLIGDGPSHKRLRQRSIQYGFIDDFEAFKKSSEQSGDTRTLIEKRFSAYYDKMKIFYISTPELKQMSNIEPVFLLGDQRYFHVPCPCCGEYIVLKWTTDFLTPRDKEKAGITWKLDENGHVLPDSVGYICQSCGDFFDESKKMEMISAGEWRPTAQPSQIGYYSYHISALYSPPGMTPWEQYVRDYLEAAPPGGNVDQGKMKVFMNTCLGMTYEDTTETIQASVLQRNIRNYKIGIIPESLSISDGNGKIILLTCSCDLNGKEDDARLDYEIAAWAESGAHYSIRHGSIGTFIPNERSQIKKDREKWSYQHNHPRSVWPVLESIVSETYLTDTANPTKDDLRAVGRKMKIAITGVDTGFFTIHAYNYLDNTNCFVKGLKGDKESKFRRFDIDMASFKQGKERPDLFLIDVNYMKDRVADYMKLKWKPGDPKQPDGFMNFPQPSDGLYGFENYFEHFESEHRVSDMKDGKINGYMWMKKNSTVQNHCFDTKIYNYALRDIFVMQVMKERKTTGTWIDFVKMLTKK